MRFEFGLHTGDCNYLPDINWSYYHAPNNPMPVKLYPDPLTFARVIRKKPILSKYILHCYAYA